MSNLHALHKILLAHAHPRPVDVVPGEFLELEPDVFAIGLGSAPAMDRLKADLADLEVSEFRIKDKIFAFTDHYTPAPTAAHANGQKQWREFFKSHDIPIADGGAGISHLLLTERGYVGPGSLIALRDTHTQTMGAVGAFAASLAGGMLSLFAIGRYWLDVPKVTLYRIEGELQKGVFARDVALHINGTMGQRGALGTAIEFAGGFVSDISMDMRFTLCNMGTEMGATASYIQPDEKTLDWVEPRVRKPFEVFETDRGYSYSDEIDFKISDFGPMIAAPYGPDNVTPLGEHEGRHIDQAYLGSCASGRLEDIAIAARVIKGHKVHPDVRFIVTAGSREVLQQALKLGYIEILQESNAIVTSAGCGACPGSHGGVLAPGEVAITTITRNFNGRMGASADVYLASPASVAASAIEGRIADPRKYL